MSSWILLVALVLEGFPGIAHQPVTTFSDLAACRTAQTYVAKTHVVGRDAVGGRRILARQSWCLEMPLA